MSGKPKTVKASDLMVQALENEGVEYIFGIPGEEISTCSRAFAIRRSSSSSRDMSRPLASWPQRSGD